MPGSASRARELARTSAAAREPLEFVAQLCEAQARCSAELGVLADGAHQVTSCDLARVSAT